MGGIWIHRLSKIDTRTSTGTCAVCGRVKLIKNKNGLYRCKIRANTSHTRQTLKIHPKEIEKLHKSQKGKCGICKKDISIKKDSHVDHDHVTMKIRGLLCGQCNRGLGNFSDDVKKLVNAIVYLSRFRAISGYTHLIKKLNRK